MEPIIKVEGLQKHFGSVKAVKGIDFQVEKGELFGFLGVNGAGKSTTINMLCTVLKPTAGKADICGLEVGKEDEEIRKKIGVVYQNNCLDDRLTVKENLFVRGALYETDRKKLTENVSRVCEILELSEVYGRKFGKLSGGWKRRCEIARALLHAPEILFLDEPTTGLDPSTRKIVWESISRLRKEENMTIFLTTHYMEEAADADYVVILDSGKIVAEGTPLELKNKYTGDYISLYTDEESVKKLNKPYESTAEGFRVAVENTAEATQLILQYPEIFVDYEIVKGKMDDVFLAATGKTLGGEKI